jgi:hypothetical protein
MTIKSRLRRLEKKQRPSGTRPIIPIFQDLDDPDLWHPGNRKADPISWDQVEADYNDYMIIKVTYTDKWRPNHDS